MLLPNRFPISPRVPVAPQVLNGLEVSIFWSDWVIVNPGRAVLTNTDGSFIIVADVTRTFKKTVLSLWQPGTEVGGRDAGSDENGDWFVYVIYNPEKYKTDVLLSMNPEAPTLPQGYTFFAKIANLWRTMRVFELEDRQALENAPARRNWSSPINNQVYNGILPNASNPVVVSYHIYVPDRISSNLTHADFGPWYTPGVSYGSHNFIGGAYCVVTEPNAHAVSEGAFLIPHNSTVSHVVYIGQKYDVNATFPGSGAYANGVTLRDGRVFLIPYNATQARIYNPKTNTVEVITGHTFPGNGAYYSGTLMRDNRVFLCPWNATAIRIFDPATNQVQVLSHSMPGNGGFYGARLLRSGRILLIPHTATKARLYDPVNNTLVEVGPTLAGGGAYMDAVPTFTASAPGTSGAFDAFVFVPHGSTSALGFRIVINQDLPENTVQTFSVPGTYPGSGAYVGGALSMDGRIFLCPYNASTHGVLIDFDANTAVAFGNTAGSAKHQGCVSVNQYWIQGIARNATSYSLVNPINVKYPIPLWFRRSPLVI